MTGRQTLVTFGMGSSRWRRAAHRLARQGERSGWFSDIQVWDGARLRRDLPRFWSRHGAFIEENPRGWGYWVWRPAIIEWHIERASVGESFAFLDAGCELNLSGLARKTLDEYMVQARTVGLTVMQVGEPIGRWCKPDLLAAAYAEGLSPLEELVEPGVLLASGGSEAALSCVRTWASWCTRDGYHLLDDSVSVLDPPADFREHRHDQAVLTCVLPREMAVPHASYFPGRWRSDGASQPVWACRNSLPVLVEQPTLMAATVRRLRRVVHAVRP